MDIYVLKDPNNKSVRYVGITRQPLKERLRLHIKQARIRNREMRYLNAKDKWILKLLAMDKKPTIVAIAKGLPESVAVREEKKIIEIFRRTGEGGSLLNIDVGGAYNICREKKPWNKGLTDIYDPELLSMMKENQPQRKDIYRFDKKGNFIDSWISLRTMCSELGLDRRAVMRCLAKTPNYYSHKGFMYSHSRNDVPVYYNNPSDYTRDNRSYPRTVYGVKNDVRVEFSSMREAAEFMGIGYMTLKRALENGKSLRGYCWYYSKNKQDGRTQT